MTKMKKMKKMMALVLAVAMCLAMSMTTTVMSFADGATATDGHTISVSNNDTHEYKVFQVLTGTLAAEGSQELGNPAWGADAITNPGDVNAFIASLKADGVTEQDVAQLVAGKVDTTTDGRGTIKKGQPLENLATGYYVLVDVTTLEKYGSDPEKIDTKALNVVKVVNDINGIDIKWGTTEDKKEIVSDTLGKNSGVNNFNPATDTDNVSIGDTVNFKITAKVPANANLYNYFFFVINDTLDKGLTFTENSLVVYKESVSDDDANVIPATKYGFEKTTGADGKTTFKVGLKDAKEYAGKDIIVTYSAVLNKDAEIGEVPNKNTSTVQYSNDPNHDYNGTNHPAFPATADESAMGETPVTETKTYTTGIEIQKVDQDGKVLTGATFELSGVSTKTVLTVAETFAEAADGNYYKLKDGTYTKTVPTTTGEYMVKTPGATAGYVVDDSYAGEDKKVVGGKTYRPYAPDTDEGKDVYVLTTGNADLYESTETKYKKSTQKTANDVKSSHKITMAVNGNGLARFDGLGAGTYTIKETGTPSGYNPMADMTVTVTFTANGTQKWTFSGGNGSYDAEEGIYKITIENQKGTELPSTGGMGTTIFYIAGAILVIGAVVLLIARKKAER